MKRHNAGRWTPPLPVRINPRQVWFLIAGAAATIVILLFLVRAVS